MALWLLGDMAGGIMNNKIENTNWYPNIAGFELHVPGLGTVCQKR